MPRFKVKVQLKATKKSLIEAALTAGLRDEQVMQFVNTVKDGFELVIGVDTNNGQVRPLEISNFPVLFIGKDTA